MRSRIENGVNHPGQMIYTDISQVENCWPRVGIMSWPSAALGEGVSSRTRTQDFILELLQAAAEPLLKLWKSGSEQLWQSAFSLGGQTIFSLAGWYRLILWPVSSLPWPLPEQRQSPPF